MVSTRFFIALGFLLSLSFNQSFAQTINHYYASTGKLKESYEVKDTLSGIKEGAYSCYYFNGKLRQKGSYFNNNKAGLWEYFNEQGELTERYNYDFGNSAYYREDHSRFAGYLVEANIDTSFLAQLDRLPHLPGGYTELSYFLLEHLKYPAIAKENRIGGTVIVSFTVSKDGRILKPKIVRGIGSGCDDEVLRIMELMPAWVPALKNGQECDQLFYLPITFSPPKPNTMPHGE